MKWQLLTGLYYGLIIIAVLITVVIVVAWPSIQARGKAYKEGLITWLNFRRTKRILDRHATSMGVKVALNGSIRRKP